MLLRVCGTFARRRSFLQLASLLTVQGLYTARELPAEAGNVERIVDFTNDAFETLRKQCVGLTPWLPWQCLPLFISDPGDCCFVQEEIRELPGLNRRRLAGAGAGAGAGTATMFCDVLSIRYSGTAGYNLG